MNNWLPISFTVSSISTSIYGRSIATSNSKCHKQKFLAFGLPNHLPQLCVDEVIPLLNYKYTSYTVFILYQKVLITQRHQFLYIQEIKSGGNAAYEPKRTNQELFINNTGGILYKYSSMWYYSILYWKNQMSSTFRKKPLRL